MTASNPRVSARGDTRSTGEVVAMTSGRPSAWWAARTSSAQGWTRSMSGSTARLPARRVASADRPRMTAAAARARPMKGTDSPNRL